MAENKVKNNLRAKIKIDIDYVKSNGSLGVKTVEVWFISQAIMKMYAEFKNETLDVVQLAKRSEVLIQEMGMAAIGGATAKPMDERIKDVEPLKDEQERILAKLKEIGETSFDRKFNIVHAILTKNGVKDVMLLDKKWWYENVDINMLCRFIETACEKDNELITNKKKEWAK